MNIISSFLEKGILISPEIANDPLLIEKLGMIDEKDLKGIAFIDKNFLNSFIVSGISHQGAGTEKQKEENALARVKVLFSYNKEPGKIAVGDFVAYFNRRFEALSSILRQRQEMQKVTSIGRIKNKAARESVTLMGLVYEKTVTKNNNIMLTLEDPSGKVNILISDKKKELFNSAKEVVLDELIGVEGMAGGNFVMANQIFIPDVPLMRELKKSPEEEYMALIGDPHFGSKAFLKKEFDDFIEWINQKKGSEEQKEIASKVKYLIIIGDLVEGVGIYPGQEQDLEINDIKEQYDSFADYLKKIPSNIAIIACPGNHDAGRISEPQPPLLHKYADSIRKLPNVVLLSNPALVNIGAINGFSGFDLLLYHGVSLIYYSDHIDFIRQKGGQKRPDLLMKLLLQMRHLAPSHTSNQYTPDASFDPLVINKIPDFFITGHIHRVSVSNYKNITLLNCSCWTDITEDQEKRGLQPQPGRVPLVNLHTREVKVINFFREEKEDKEDKNERHEAEKANETLAIKK
jgi:DNA polymerase II small subunit